MVVGCHVEMANVLGRSVALEKEPPDIAGGELGAVIAPSLLQGGKQGPRRRRSRPAM